MLILFDYEENQVGRLLSTDLAECIQSDPLNGTMMLDFTVHFDRLAKMENVEIVAHRDVINPDSLQAYKIQIEEPTSEGMSYRAVHIAMDDLRGYGYVREERLEHVQASVALTRALNGCRWEVGEVAPTDPSSIYFYDLSRLECISKILETWNLEIQFRVNIENNRLGSRYIDLIHKRGHDTGRRYVYGANTLEVTRERNQSGLYTAVIPRGKGEEKFEEDGTATGGYGRRIQITDVEWSKANGDPLDKPRGQEYLEIPEMTEKFGYSDGSARFKVVVYSEIEDPNQLIKKAYEDLVVNSRPLVQFEASISETGDLELGDQVGIIRHDLNIYYYTRVFNIERNLLTGQNTKIELGDNLNITQADFNKSLRQDISRTENDLTSSIAGAVKRLQHELNESMFDDNAYWYFLDMDNDWGYAPGFYTFNKPIDESPSKGVFVGSGRMGVANSRDSNGKLFFTTWLTGDGLIADHITSGTLNADLIKAGTLSDVKGNVWFDLSTGSFNINNQIIYKGQTGELTIKAVESLDTELTNKLDNNQKQTNQELNKKANKANIISEINVSSEGIRIAGNKVQIDGTTYIQTGVIDTAHIANGAITNAKIDSLSANKITTGTLDASRITVSNLNANSITTGTLNVTSGGTHRGPLNNTSASLGNGSYSADIQGSATGIQLNSSLIQFIYGSAPRIVVSGRVDAQPSGRHHSLELNGLSINSGQGWFKNTGSFIELGASKTLRINSSRVEIPNLRVDSYDVAAKLRGIESDISDAFNEIRALKNN